MKRSSRLVAVVILSAASIVMVMPSAGADEHRGAAEPPALQPGEEWFYFHLFLDARTEIFSSLGCEGNYSRTGPWNEACGGEYASATTTAPFNGGAGTAKDHHEDTVFESPRIKGTVEFLVPNNVIRGDYRRGFQDYPYDLAVFNVSGIATINGTRVNLRVGDTGADKGEKGGPLRLGERFYSPVLSARKPYGLTFDLRGWLILSPAQGAEGPTIEAPSSTEPATPPSDPAPTIAATRPAPAPAAQPLIGTPRFTG